MIKNLLPFLFFHFIINTCFAQHLQLTIIDEEGEPLVSATVVSLDQQWSDFTSTEGTVMIPDSTDAVQILYIGFEPSIYSYVALKALPDHRLQLTSSVKTLESAVVVGRRGESLITLPYQVNRIDAKTIALAQSSTTVDALSDFAGVFVQKSQLGGGSPILRGFEANRVLLVLDGIRLNNAIYRSGHLQNAITVDEAALDAMEVIFGAGSLSYGSDALGGVIHFKTKSPAFFETSEKRFSVDMGTNYGSINKSKAGHLGFQFHGKNIATYTAITVSSFGDLQIGKENQKEHPGFGQRPDYIIRKNGVDQIIDNPNPHLLVNSGYDQFDLLQKIRFRLHSSLELVANFQYSTSSDVPRYDRLTERRNDQLRFAEWHYGPQDRFLGAIHVKWQAEKTWTDHVQIILAQQNISEDRHDRRFQNLWRELSLVDVSVQSLNLDLIKNINPNWRIDYGVDATHNKVLSEGFLQNIETLEIDQFVNPRYPGGGSTLSAAGVYSQLKYHQPSSNWHAEVGGRWAWQEVQSTFTTDTPIAWPERYINGIKANNNAFTWAAGVHWKPRQWQFKALIATGFRAPNVDDFAKFREKNNFIQIPNPELQPEKSLTTELSVARKIGGLKWNGTVFHTWLQNSIVRQNHQLTDGNPWLINRGDSLRVQANTNAGQAAIWGISSSVTTEFGKYWSVKGSLSYTVGSRPFIVNESLETVVPLDHIPPLYGHLSLNYKKKHYQLSFRSKFQGTKRLEDYAISNATYNTQGILFDRTGTTDNLEQTPFDTKTNEFVGATSWWLLHFNSSWQVNQNIQLLLSCENIFDRAYRPFASGINGSGRNFIVGIKAKF